MPLHSCATAPQGGPLAKFRRKTAIGRSTTHWVTDHSPQRASASNEAATALGDWETEGGTTASASRFDENGASPRTPLDRFLLERLGAALVGEWSDLPMRLQRMVYERAVAASPPLHRPTIRRQMARFLHEHKHRARRAQTAEATLADDAQASQHERGGWRPRS